MDGLSITAGVGPSLTIGGRSFMVKARDLDFYSRVEAEILKTRGNPLTMVVESARSLVGESDQAEAALILDRVAHVVATRFRNWRFATYTDYSDFFETPHGDAFQIWLSIRHNDPTLTVEQIERWLWEEIDQGGATRLYEIRDTLKFASAEDPLGNSGGPPLKTVPNQAG